MLKPQVLPGEQIPCELLVEKPAVNQEFDDTASEQFDHRLEAGERGVEKGTLIVESTLQNDGMEMRILWGCPAGGAQPAACRRSSGGR